MRSPWSIDERVRRALTADQPRTARRGSTASRGRSSLGISDSWLIARIRSNRGHVCGVERGHDHMSMPVPKRPDVLDAQARELTVYLDELVRRLVATRRSSTAYEGLSRHEFAVVDALGTHGPIVMKDLAERVQLSSALLSTVATQLTTRRLARRQASQTDRRVVRLELTPAGFALYRAVEESRLQVARRLLGAFDQRERNDFLALLRRAVPPPRPFRP